VRIHRTTWIFFL